MTYSQFPIYLSYSQLCIFGSSLDQPFNDWNDRHFSQGFSWRESSVSFRALKEAGNHDVHLHINEPVPEFDYKSIRAFKVPFIISENLIEIGSISNSKVVQIIPDTYSLQVEFYADNCEDPPAIIVRLNTGDTSFSILKGDDQIITESELDLISYQAS